MGVAGPECGRRPTSPSTTPIWYFCCIATEMTAESAFCETPDGAKLAYRILGAKQKGLPLLMLTGMASVKEDWDQMANDLARTRPVCIYDHRGIGESRKAPPTPPFQEPSQLTVMQMATDAFSLLEHLGWRRFHLFGMSMGGMLSQQLALLLRGRDDYTCVSLTLLCTSAKPRRRRMMMEYYQFLSAELEARDSGGAGAGAGKVIKMVRTFLEGNMTPEWCRRNPEKVEEMLMTNAKLRKPARIIVQQIEALSSGFDVTSQLHLIDIPTLVVHGTADEVLPIEDGQAIADGIPGAVFVPLSDIGHITYRMDDGQTFRAVDTFLHQMDAKNAVASPTAKL
ncbi:hypothetical protein HDU86_002532 [Geranomyces michiganensis]|nr:hypothetical protein HDU86_002532 [Geranomyces michiganensis]